MDSRLGVIRYKLIKWCMRRICRMPYPLATAIGRSLGALAWLCIPLHRKIVTMQLKATGNYKTGATIKAFCYQGENMIDSIRLSKMKLPELKRRVEVEGLDNLQDAMGDKRGVMLISGHIGPWELISHIVRLLEVEFSIMADQRDDPWMERIISDIHASGGAQILPPKGGLLKMLISELSEGRNIGILVDQRGNRTNRVVCDFMGLPAPTNPAFAYIALKSDAILLPVHFTKLPKGRFRITFAEPVAASSFGNDHEQIIKLRDAHKSTAVQNLSAFTQKWAGKVINQQPLQWFWVHSRWTRRSDMKKIIRNRLNFKEYIEEQARMIDDGSFGAHHG